MSEEKKYLLVNDVLYDVSEFAHKHPGGAVLRTMLWNENEPRDASVHFREFHYRQNQSPTSQVKELLSAMPKAPIELQMKAKELRQKRTQHEVDLMKDFIKLRQELEKKGYFEGSYFLIIIRLIIITLFLMLGYYLLQYSYFLGMFFMAWSFQQYGWVQHEGGHRSLTGNVSIDNAIQFFILYVIYGGSGYFWNYQHNNHHANTQHDRYDIDLKTLPLVAFDYEVLDDDENTIKKEEKNESDSG